MQHQHRLLMNTSYIYRILIGCHSVHPKLLFSSVDWLGHERSWVMLYALIYDYIHIFFSSILRPNIYYWLDFANMYVQFWRSSEMCHVMFVWSWCKASNEQNKTKKRFDRLMALNYPQTRLIAKWTLHFQFSCNLVPHPCSDRNNCVSNIVASTE